VLFADICLMLEDIIAEGDKIVYRYSARGYAQEFFTFDTTDLKVLANSANSPRMLRRSSRASEYIAEERDISLLLRSTTSFFMRLHKVLELSFKIAAAPLGPLMLSSLEDRGVPPRRERENDRNSARVCLQHQQGS
jgi:hypothetical protein